MTAVGTRSTAHAGRDPARAYLCCFLVLGAALTFVGPALTTLRDEAGVSTGAISALFGTQSAGYLLGAILGGRAFDAGLGHRLMAGALVAVAATMLAISVASALPMLLLLFFLQGLTASAVDVGGNTLLVWSRGSGVGPMINALHLMFAAGALTCPILVNRSLAWTGDLGPACWISAGAAVAVAGFVLTRDEPKPGAHELSAGRTQAPQALLAVIAGFFVLYVGVELGFAGWVYAYGQELDVGGENGPAWLTATFWATFALGRLVAIPLAAVISPRVMLLCSCGLAAGAAALLVVVGGSSLVWFGTALFGLAISPQFPTMIAFAERHLAITGNATAWFIGASAVGGFVLPWSIGQLFERTGASAMPVAVLSAAVATLLWFCLVARLLGRRVEEPVPT